MPGWQFSAKVFMDGGPWVPQPDLKFSPSVDPKFASIAEANINSFLARMGEQVPRQIAGEIPFTGESVEAFEKRRPKKTPPKEPVVSKKPPKIFRWLLLACYIVYTPIMMGVAESLGYDDSSQIKGVFWPFWILYEMGKFIGSYI